MRTATVLVAIAIYLFLWARTVTLAELLRLIVICAAISALFIIPNT